MTHGIHIKTKEEKVKKDKLVEAIVNDWMNTIDPDFCEDLVGYTIDEVYKILGD